MHVLHEETGFPERVKTYFVPNVLDLVEVEVSQAVEPRSPNNSSLFARKTSTN